MAFLETEKVTKSVFKVIQTKHAILPAAKISKWNHSRQVCQMAVQCVPRQARKSWLQWNRKHEEALEFQNY